MSRKELDYFQIEGSLGGSQDWFFDWSMHFGGCAAVTACDLCLYLALHRGRTFLYPFSTSALSRRDFVAFGKLMKPYLRPRTHGVNRLSLYTEGICGYWRSRGAEDLMIEELPGETPPDRARDSIRAQLDRGIPIPFLMLRHQNRQLQDYIWHWFMLAGYEERDTRFLVKAVTYGEGEWLDFDMLWNTGFAEKGGAILVRETARDKSEES